MTRSRVLLRIQSSLFAVLTASAYFIAAGPPGGRGLRYLGLHLVLSLLMLGAWTVGRTVPTGDHRWTLVAGLLARLVLVAVPPFTTRDVDRYLWDGRVALAGLDPYRVTPDSPEAAKLRAEGWPAAEHPDIPTCYPPGAVALFALCASFGPNRAPLVWKGLVTLGSGGTLWLVARVLRKRSAERHLALVALSPLLVLEGGVGGHLDSLSSFFIVLALSLASREKRPTATGAALASGALLKVLPALALFPLAARLRPRDSARLLGAAAATMAAGYGIAFLAGLDPIGSLPRLFVQWRFGSPVFAWASSSLGDEAAGAIGWMAGASCLLAAVLLARRGKWTEGMFASLAAPFLAGPVVFPWYLCSLVPFLSLLPTAFGIAWATALPLTYEVLDRFDVSGEWSPAAWPLWAIGIAWVLGLVIDGVRLGRSRRRDPPEERPDADPASDWKLGAVSVILPVFNEETRIVRRLGELAATPGVREVIVVDGGSTDRTVQLARSFSEARVLSSERGRARQMNVGGAMASGEVFLFLHADVSLPRDVAGWVAGALSDRSVVAGAFRTRTVPDGDSSRNWLAPFLRLADLRSRHSSLPYGDQALFVRAEVFRRLGGFADLPLMEDLELSRRLARVGKIRTVAATVQVSGRRFLARPVFYTLLVNVFPLLYRMGVSPRVLSRVYGDPR